MQQTLTNNFFNTFDDFDDILTETVIVSLKTLYLKEILKFWNFV